MRKILVLIIFIFLISLVIIYFGFTEKVTFINAKPSIRLNDTEYVVTQDTLSRKEVGIPFGRVTNVIELVSYSDNPYKGLKWIYKIKDKDIQGEVALGMNGRIYICKACEEIEVPSSGKNR